MRRARMIQVSSHDGRAKFWVTVLDSRTMVEQGAADYTCELCQVTLDEVHKIERKQTDRHKCALSQSGFHRWTVQLKFPTGMIARGMSAKIGLTAMLQYARECHRAVFAVDCGYGGMSPEEVLRRRGWNESQVAV